MRKTNGNLGMGRFLCVLLLFLLSFSVPSVSGAAQAQVSKNESVTFSAGGGFQKDGRPLFLFGNIIYGVPSLEEYEPFFMNIPGWEWLYEKPPTREQFDRLGFNASGGEVSVSWLRKYRPERWFWQAGAQLDWACADGYYKCGLPVFVDFTCAGWSHGGLTYDPNRPPSKDAFSHGSCHFMPYSLISEEGFTLYKEMWQSGAKELREHGVKPMVYELFNEPTYEDDTPLADKLFEKFAASIPADAPPAARKVARIKFNERIFARGMKRGKEALREVDPEARTCFQPLGIGFGFVNPLLANETTDIVMTPTGGGGPYEVLACLAIAGNRPIVDGETYLGATRSYHRAAILQEYARGINGFYYFKWGRRSRRDGTWKKPNGPQILAEVLPYECLNPAAVKPKAFAGIKDAARDVALVNDLFTPRFRGLTNSIAVLISQPTERLDRAEKHPNATYTREAVLALLAARLPIKVVYEEQLDARHLKDVKLLVAAGVDATLPETNDRLRRWVEKGGTLLTVENKLDLTEWGEKNPSAFVTGRNQALGRGHLIHLPRRLSAREAAAYYCQVAEGLGIAPSCIITDARSGEELPDVECEAARNARGAGFILINHGLAPRAIRLNPQSVGADCRGWVDVSTRKGVTRTDAGELLVKLLPFEPVVLRGSPRRLAQKPESPATFLAGLSDWIAANRPDASTDAYWVDSASVRLVDLSRAANVALEDVFGKIPWGRQVCEGVPFEFIRIDQNDGRSGIGLDRGAITVPSEGKANAVHVLYAVPDGAKGTLFTVHLNYADGTSAALDFAEPNDRQLVGWRNHAGKTLWMARRGNPQPGKSIASVSFEERTKGVMIAALSLEMPSENPFVAGFAEDNLNFVNWGEIKTVVKDGVVDVLVSDASSDWAGNTSALRQAIPLTTDDVTNRSFVVEVNLGETSAGAATQPAATPQFLFGYRTADGEEKTGAYVAYRGAQVDADPTTWQTIRIPLRRLVASDAVAITRINLQFRPFGSQRAGVRLRALRIE